MARRRSSSRDKAPTTPEHKHTQSLVLKRWATVPHVPAVYAMYGGWAPRLWVAYVGIASDLNKRLVQHFDKRDSSVTTGTAAAVINPDAVRLVRWWEHKSFRKNDHLHAAELVAFDVLNPALRSRGAPRKTARELATDEQFRAEMTSLFDAPSGEFRLPWMWDMDTRIDELEHRVAELENRP